MKKIYLYSIIVFSACFFLFILIFVSYLPYSPISVSNRTKNHFQTFLPQGWFFFTRNPKEEAINIYQVKGNSVENINCKSGDIKNLFGAKKSGRMQMAEVGEILCQIPDSLWMKNRGKITDHKILDTLTPLPLVNSSGFKSLKGLIIIERIEPVPWAWCKSKNTIKMPSQFVYLNIK